MKLPIALVLSSTLFAGLVFTQDDDQLLFAYQISKIGLPNGIGGPDLFGTTWKSGELHNMGKRSNYLAGRQLRDQYITKRGFLTAQYDQRQVFLRAQGNNRSMDSAYAFMQGLYLAESNTRVMMSNQTNFALPEMKVQDDILSDVQSSLQNIPIPYNLQMVPVVSVGSQYDTFFPYQTCTYLRNGTGKSVASLITTLDAKYENVLKQFNTEMQLLQGTSNKYTSKEVNTYFDSLYARKSQGLDTPGFDDAFISQLQQVSKEYREGLIALDPVSAKAKQTAFIQDLQQSFSNKVNDTQNAINYDPDSDDAGAQPKQSPLKMKMLFEDGDLISNILGLGVIPYTSQLIFELHFSASLNKYSVVMMYNWQQTPIPGPCNNQLSCELSNFLDFLAAHSLNATEYLNVCGSTPRQLFQAKQDAFAASLNEVKYVKRSNYLRILELYALSMLVILIMWACYSVFYGKQEPPHIEATHQPIEEQPLVERRHTSSSHRRRAEGSERQRRSHRKRDEENKQETNE